MILKQIKYILLKNNIDLYYIYMDNIEREYLKFLQRKVKESKPVAEPKAKQVQVAPSLPEVVASEAPAPRKRGRKPKSEESVAPIA
jgi:hypothetical protein